MVIFLESGGRVPPGLQVHARDLGARTGQAGVQLVVGKQHGPELDGLHCVGVVTDQSGE